MKRFLLYLIIQKHKPSLDEQCKATTCSICPFSASKQYSNWNKGRIQVGLESSVLKMQGIFPKKNVLAKSLIIRKNGKVYIIPQIEEKL